MGDSPMPTRGNLAVDCARVIRHRIIEGEWCGMLPGERRLAELLEVGRDTVRLALTLLERDQVIGPTQAGSKRGILLISGHADRPRKQALRIGMLSPRRLEQLSQPVLFEVDHLRRALAGKGGSLELFAPAWYDHKDPAKRLARLVEAEPCSAWILFRSSARIQDWFAKSRVPCLIRGYPHEMVDLPHLDVDWEATARHAAGRLWRLGHRRVGVMVPPDGLRGVEAAVKGAGGLGEEDFRVIEIPENGRVEGVIMALSRALRLKEPPTAFIATRPRQAATAMTWLCSQGIGIPRRISMISLAHEPFLDHLVPAVSGYRVNPEAVSKHVIRRIEALLSGNPERGGNSWITPDLVKGESLGECRPDRGSPAA
jgi:DNA-binding LacI/PurR family transcriptional regulator